MSSNKVYFITGANRGIGLEFVKSLAADSKNTVIASARDPAKATELNALASKGNVHVIKLDVSSEESIAGLDSQLAKVASDGIDYFISNAGIAQQGSFAPALEVGKKVWFDHFNTNAVGPVLVTQVVKPYLLKKDTRVIFFVSSLVGSLGGFFEASTSAYGMSKAALNHFVKTIGFELRDEGFIVIASHPGVVSTDMGNSAADWAPEETRAAFKPLIITPADSAAQQLAVISKLTKEDNSKFLSYTGEELTW